MFNSVNNPFSQMVKSTMNMGQDSNRQQKQQQEDEETNYLGNEENDEVKISKLPELTEEQIITLVNDYIKKLKEEHEDNPKIMTKLDKYLTTFNVQKFMKRNPKITSSDFYMVMFNETEKCLH